MKRFSRFCAALAAACVFTGVTGIFWGDPAAGQLSALVGGGAATGDSKALVSFVADQIDYDKTGNLITATGHVQAVQNGQTLYADQVVLDRARDIATASGHVILLEPSGQTVFADHAVLSQGMKNAVMQMVSARLAQNGRLIANGARRYDDKVDVLAKVVYSACNLCKTDPRAAPLWQIRATSATRDLEHKRIEFRNAEMEIAGFPVFYTPFLSEPDPSVRRQTGLLIPSLGVSSKLGFFVTMPYFIVLGPSSDVTVTPILAAKQGPAVDAKYRRAFNNGILNIDLSGGEDHGSLGNSVFSNGTFDLNQDWRAGFSLNRASNPQYLNDFRILPNASYLSSNIFIEGFAPGAYARLDGDFYQGLVASVNQSELPIVLPHAQYSFESATDSLGGHFDFDADTFNILRKLGTNDRRIAGIGGYALPFRGPLGQMWQARVELIAASYNASRLYDQPNFSHLDSASAARVVPFGALMLRWPFIRPAGAYGSQLLEPEAQIVTAPNVGTSQNYRIPNEDSLDLEFTDANLFSLNRYPGIDRIEGGSRVDYALHGAWYLPSGAMLDGLFGQSYRFRKDADYLPLSGLTDNVSDFVGHLIIAPSPLFSLSYRTRLNHSDFGARLIDTTATVGNPTLNVSAGYLYSNTDPYNLYSRPTIQSSYFTPRHEITFNLGTSFGRWSFSGGAQRDLTTGRFDNGNFNATWQNECAAASLLFYRRVTSFNLDRGNTTVLIQFTFKTLGNVGFSAL